MKNTKKQINNASSKTKTLVISALFAALVCITTAYLLHIPMGNGEYVHIGDAFIYLGATLLPLPYALGAATIGSGLADLLTGSVNWVFPTIIIKSILVLFFSNKGDKIINFRNVSAAALAGVTGTLLYMVASALMYGLAGAFVFTILLIIQPVGSFIVFILAGLAFDKLDIKKIIKNK